MLKPAVSTRNLVLTAALLWSGIGLMLLGRGWFFAGRHAWLPLLVALVVGTAKSFLVLDRTARRNLARILAMPDRSCVGSVYSWRMWGLVVLMMVMGRLLRMSPVPPVYVGGLLMAIGWALLLSSRLIWIGWRDFGLMV